MEGVVRLYAVLVFATLVLNGCAQPAWTSDYFSQSQYRVDRAGCATDARAASAYTGGLVSNLDMKDYFKECMVSHGYVEVSR
jgi:hypothetical protein